MPRENFTRRNRGLKMDVKGKSAGRNRIGSFTYRISDALRKRGGMAAFVIDLICVGCGYMFAQTHAVFGAYPFGIAFLCAARRDVLLIFAALIAGAARLGDTGYVYMVVYAIILILRLIISKPGERRFLPPSARFFGELPQLSVALSCVCGFALAVYQILVGGVETYSILFAVTTIVASTLLTFAYLGVTNEHLAPREVFSSRGPLPLHYPIFFQISACVLLFSAVYAMSPYELFGVSANSFAATVIALAAARRFGALRGGIAGLVVGAAVSPVTAPAIAIIGLLSGLLRRSGLFFTIGTACVCAIGYITWADGVSGFVSLAPEVVFAAALSWPLLLAVKRLSGEDDDIASPGAGAKAKKKAAAKTASATVHTSVREAKQAHIEGLADSLGRLSKVFYTLSDSSPLPGALDYRETLDGVCRKYCISCKKFDECWKRGDAGCAAAVRSISEKYGTMGVASLKELPEKLRGSCPCLEMLIADIATSLAMLDTGRRARDKSKLISLDYELISSLISEAAVADKLEAREDVKAGMELRRALRPLGIVSGDIAVYGQRRRSVIAGGIDWEGSGVAADDIRAVAETFCGCTLSNPGFEIEDGMITMQMSTVRRFSVEYARATAAKDGEESGDNSYFFENCEDYFYSLICDGMGSGREAARTSGLCGMFLEKMLGAGNPKSSSLKLLNHAMRNRGIECSSTIDLFEIDLLYGRGCFVKSGAAPSYVRRGERLFRIQSKTVPVGLLRALDAEQVRFDLTEGDVIVMLSDGVVQAGDDASWLCNLLSHGWVDDLNIMAQKILTEAKGHSERSDDITVSLVKVVPYRAKCESESEDASLKKVDMDNREAAAS